MTKTGRWFAVALVALVAGCSSAEERERTKRKLEAIEAMEARAKALEARRATVERELEERAVRFDEIGGELQALEEELEVASRALNEAQSDADRQAALARLQAAEVRKTDLKAALSRLQAEMRDAERKRKEALRDDCKNNPLGC